MSDSKNDLIERRAHARNLDDINIVTLDEYNFAKNINIENNDIKKTILDKLGCNNKVLFIVPNTFLKIEKDERIEGFFRKKHTLQYIFHFGCYNIVSSGGIPVRLVIGGFDLYLGSKYYVSGDYTYKMIHDV